MTLIARTLCEGHPMLIGDILITSDTKSKELEIPTFLTGVEEFLPDHQSGFPVLLREKIYVINDLLCVALGGNMHDMRRFLEDLVNFFKYYPTTVDNLERFLSSYDLSSFSSIAYFIIIALENGETAVFKEYMYPDPWPNTETPYFGKVYAIGSGRVDFFEQLHVLYELSNVGDGGLYNKALSLNFITLVQLLASERLTLRTIQKRWGAGFEVITFENNKFSKIDDLTYLIFKEVIDKEGNISGGPFLAIHYKYYDDILAITSFGLTKPVRYAVLPIYMQNDDPAISKIPLEVISKIRLDAKKICCCFVVQTYDRRFLALPFFTENYPDKPGLINVKMQDGQLSVKIENSFHEHIRQRAKIKFDEWRSRDAKK
jgi:hypothetical protein